MTKDEVEQLISEANTEAQTVEELQQQVEHYEEQLAVATVVTQTPIHDVSWFVKWAAALIGIVGAMLTAADITPWNVVLGVISMIGWAYVGVLWNDRAMIVMNVFLAGAFMQSLIPVLKVYLGG